MIISSDKCDKIEHLNYIGKFKHFQKKSDSRIFGHGTLSGDFIPQPKSVDPPIEESEYWKYKSVSINNVDNVTVEGITIANAAFHTFNLVIEESLLCLIL